MNIPLPETIESRTENTIWGLVNPELASKYMQLNMNNPRPITRSTVEKYKKEILAGTWASTHQGIAFDIDGNLIDGQHRLQAIIETGSTLYMPVSFALHPTAKNVMDIGKVRIGNDVLRLNGFDVSDQYSAIVKAAVIGFRSARISLSMSEQLKYARLLFDGVKFVTEHVPGTKKTVSISQVRGAIVRAFYANECHRQRLAEFCQVLVSGMNKTEADQPAIMLRNWLLTSPGVRNAASCHEAYAKTIKAIDAFIHGRTIKSLTPATNEIFSLEWESSLAA